MDQVRTYEEWKGEYAQIARHSRSPIFRMKVRDIYVIAVAEFCKIGISWNAKARVRQINTSTPFAAKLVRRLPVPRLLVEAAEIEAHRLLADYRSKGEWFAVSHETAIEAVEEAVSRTTGVSRNRAQGKRPT